MTVSPKLRALVLALFAAATGPASAQERCFAPADLQSRPGEERIIASRRGSVTPPPANDTAAVSPYAWRGVLRRVDLPPGRKVVALTFDLCEQPHEVAGYQGAIPDYLRQNGVKATFFSGGKWLLTHRERAQQLTADPLFQMGNHAWAHRNLRLLLGAALDAEIGYAQSAFHQVSTDLAKRQCRPAAAAPHVFRFPYGACNPQAIAAVEAAGLRAIQWDVSSADPWKGQTADRMAADVLKRVRPGSIVLFHANGRGWQTEKALPVIVAALRAQGYTFETVDGLLAVPGARPVTTPLCYDAKPGDTDRYDTLSRVFGTPAPAASPGSLLAPWQTKAP